MIVIRCLALATICALVGFGRVQDGEAPPPAPPVPQQPPTAPEAPSDDPAESQPPSPPGAALPDARQLFHEARAACGEAEKFASLKSVSIKATLPLATGENTLEAQSVRTGPFRFIQRAQDQPGVTVCFNGATGWIVQPDGRFELIDQFTLERGRHQFNAMFPYWQVWFPEDQFQSFETIEKSTFNEHECFKVRLNDDRSRKVERFAHLDVEEKIMRGMTVSQESETGTVSVQFRFDEWKTIDCLKVFTRLSIDQPNHPIVLNYTHVEFNTVDEATFEPPDAVKQLIEARDAPPASQNSDNAPPVESDESPATEVDEGGDRST